MTGGLDLALFRQLLSDRDEYLRAWTIQLLGEPPTLGEKMLPRLELLAWEDPSPIVRLYLAALLQKLPVRQRWALAEGLAGHAEDAADANLPLMIWYGIEPAIAGGSREWRAVRGNGPVAVGTPVDCAAHRGRGIGARRKGRAGFSAEFVGTGS